MVPHILAMAQQVPARTVLDGFAGTTRVAQALAASKYHVMCNDLAYFDPPYGSNNEKRPPSRVRYAAYYHLWTSICRFDRPILFGKAQRRTVPTRRLHPFSKSSAGMRKTISLR
jgi:adenine-specific DNA methylase